MCSALKELFGIEHPILLAPMGNVSGGALAAAVSNAGGLGLIGAGYGDADWLDREFQNAGEARIGVGFITWALARNPALLALALAYEPEAVMFSFGDCTPFLPAVREAGAKIICQVQTLAQALDAAAADADLIVAQGTEAGGHGGTRSTLTLVPAVVDAVAEVAPPRLKLFVLNSESTSTCWRRGSPHRCAPSHPCSAPNSYEQQSHLRASQGQDQGKVWVTARAGRSTTAAI